MLSEIDILETDLGGQKIKDMSSISFIGWLANKLNGVERYGKAHELITLVSSPPMMNRMPDEEKIRIVRKLIELNIVIK